MFLLPLYEASEILLGTETGPGNEKGPKTQGFEGLHRTLEKLVISLDVFLGKREKHPQLALLPVSEFQLYRGFGPKLWNLGE